MSEGGFRLPGSSYEELVNIIVAYGTRDEASNPGDVSKLDAVHRTSTSRTNGFLVEIGVLRGEREKLVTSRGRELALALQNHDAPSIRGIWREIVSTSEFLQNVVSAVKLREGMPFPTVQAYIAHSAGQPRNKPVMTGAATIVEILKSSNLLTETASGVLSASGAGGVVEPEFPEIPKGSEDSEDPSRTSSWRDGLTHQPGEEEEVIPLLPETESGGDGSVTVNIHLHVRCDPEDLDDLSPRLRALVRDLRDSRGF